jgi:transcriptional regulator with XRE-family HTH domain
MNTDQKYRKRPHEKHHHDWLEDISAYLLVCRELTGHSRESLAEENLINRSLLESVENANHFPTLKSIFILCDIYDITPSELFMDIT